jgi:MFS family permease
MPTFIAYKHAMKAITRTVWVLSLVSLFTDTASEMLYPIMPIYLKSIGFSVVLIGILEGLAEATAGLSKGYFGKLSDQTGKRMPFVQMGYSLSAISKPLMAGFATPIWIFSARTIDRLGKGLRTGARDAVLSAESTVATKGRVFGFHRSMDTLGAVAGPVIALLYLHYNPGAYRMLFLIAFAPGVLAIAATFLLRDKNIISKPVSAPVSFFSFLGYWKTSPAEYRKLVTGLLLFALFNSSDVFLLLKTKQAGVDDTGVITIYIFYNIVYAIAAFPMGIIADKLGLKKVFLFGLLLFAAVYIGMAFNSNLYVFYAFFFLYGIFAAATEGVSKAWISLIAGKDQVATAIGTYSAFQSLCAMAASTIAGIVWYWLGPAAAFIASSLVTVLVTAYLVGIPFEKNLFKK